MTDPAPASPAEKTPWYRTRATAVWGLLLVGPFALPLVWLCGGFSRKTKIILTLITAVLTYVSVLYTPVLLDRLSQSLQQAQALVKS